MHEIVIGRKPVQMVEKVVSTIVASVKTGKIGDGKIFVLPIDSICRIRTGETDKEAI